MAWENCLWDVFYSQFCLFVVSQMSCSFMRVRCASYDNGNGQNGLDLLESLEVFRLIDIWICYMLIIEVIIEDRIYRRFI